MITQDQKEQLIREALKAAENAYAPYSKYCVGAAVLTDTQKIYTGCNIENASYGLTICAERVAIFSARSHGESRFIALAVTALQDPVPMPCGACRQVMVEGDQDPLILVVSRSGKSMECRLRDLLPHSFRLL